MQARRNQCLTRQSAGGFTLIELLVVMLIIGVSVGVVSLSLIQPEEDDELLQSTDDLIIRGRWAADLAWSSGEPLGLVLVPVASGGEPEHWQYRWYRYRDLSWQRTDVAAAELPADIDIAIQNADQDWLDLRKLASAEVITPALIFYPGGEATPAQLVLESRTTPSLQQVIWIDAIGRVETQAQRDERFNEQTR